MLTNSNELFNINSKYYVRFSNTTNPDKEMKIKHYEEKNCKSFTGLISCLNEFIIPLLGDIDSLEKYIKELNKDTKDIRLYRDAIPCDIEGMVDDAKAMKIIYDCSNGKFEECKKELEDFKKYLMEMERKSSYKNILIEFINKLLTPLDGEEFATEESFLARLNEQTMMNRKKYKLLKKTKKRL